MQPDWTKVLGELLADHEIAQRKQIEPLAARVAELEKLSPELAGQVASAVRMLHEAPPLEQRAAQPSTPSRVVRIERDGDGNLVPIYDR